MADVQIDTQVNSILDALDSPAGDAPAGTDEERALQILDAGDGTQGQDAGETVSDTTTEQVEAPESEEELAPIEPPVSWKAEGKEKFKALPRDLQQAIVERESERERGLTKTQQESAEARKAADAERAGVQAERKAYSDRLNLLIDMANTMDPVIAEGQKTDWVQLAKDDPIGAFQKRAEYDQRMSRVNALMNERKQIQERMTQDLLRQANERLTRDLDFWSDADKRTAFQSDLKTYLGKHEFRPDELSSITDPRLILVSRKAMLYDQLMEQQSKIAAQKKVQQPGKTVRVQANETGSSSARVEALRRNAQKSGRTEDAVNAVLATL